MDTMDDNIDMPEIQSDGTLDSDCNDDSIKDISDSETNVSQSQSLLSEKTKYGYNITIHR